MKDDRLVMVAFEPHLSLMDGAAAHSPDIARREPKIRVRVSFIQSESAWGCSARYSVEGDSLYPLALQISTRIQFNKRWTDVPAGFVPDQ